MNLNIALIDITYKFYNIKFEQWVLKPKHNCVATFVHAIGKRQKKIKKQRD